MVAGILQDLFDLRHEHPGRERFGDVIGPLLEALDDRFLLVERRKDEDGDGSGFRVLLQQGEELEAAHPGHDHVEDEQVGFSAPGLGQALASAAGLLDHEVFLAQEMGDEVPCRRVVVDKEDFGRRPLGPARPSRNEFAEERGLTDLLVDVQERRFAGPLRPGCPDKAFQFEKGPLLGGDEIGEHRPVPLDAAGGVLELPHVPVLFDILVHDALSSRARRAVTERIPLSR